MTVVGSRPYLYLYFLHKFKTVGVKGLTAEETADLKKFISEGGNEGRKIAKRYDLLRYDEPSTSKEERAKILEDIKTELQDHGLIDFDHSKPELARSESDKSTEIQ